MPLVRRRRFRKRRGDRTTVVAYSLVILLMLAIGAGGALIALLYARQHGGWELASWTGLFHRAPVSSRVADAASGKFCRIDDPGTCSAEALATGSCRGGNITLADATPLPTKPLDWRDVAGTPLASGPAAPKAGGNGAPDRHAETPADDDLPPDLQDLVPTAGGPPGQANYWPGTPPKPPAGGPGSSPPGPNGFTPPGPPPSLTSLLPPGGGGTPQPNTDPSSGGPGAGDPPGFTPNGGNPPPGNLPPGNLPTTPTDGAPPKDGQVTAIAEPGTAALLIAGPAVLAWIRLRRRRGGGRG